MAGERIYITDLNGNQIVDVEALEAIDYATNLRFSSRNDRGFDEASFRLRRRDILSGFAVKSSYDVAIYDGLTEVWRGRLLGPRTVITAGDEYLDCQAVGWAVRLNETYIQKRWKDNMVLNHTYWPAGRETNHDQLQWVEEKRDDWLMVRAGTGSGDISRAHGEYYIAQYDAYGTIDRVTFDYYMRTGEGFKVQVWNVDNADAVDYDSGGHSAASGQSFSRDHTLTQGVTESIKLAIEIRGPSDPDLFDQNDYLLFDNFLAYMLYDTGHPVAGSEAYTNGEMALDALLVSGLMGVDLSTDTGDIDYTGLDQALEAYTLETRKPVGDVVRELLEYSDTTYQTYFLNVWGGGNSSDGLPVVEITAYDVSDYEYIIDLSGQELVTFRNEEDERNIKNYITVQYVNVREENLIRTPDDNANLTDATSVASYYQREHLLKIGKANAAQADAAGRRYLAYNKDPKPRGSITVGAEILTKNGALVPSNRVRAGQRFYIPKLDTTYYIGSTSYDAEGARLTLSPTYPPDDIVTWIARLHREATTEAPKYRGFG